MPLSLFFFLLQYYVKLLTDRLLESEQKAAETFVDLSSAKRQVSELEAQGGSLRRSDSNTEATHADAEATIRALEAEVGRLRDQSIGLQEQNEMLLEEKRERVNKVEEDNEMLQVR